MQAVLGGVYTEFGSPAAHRAFHLHYLPHIAWQLRDPMLIERVEAVKKDLEERLGGGIIVQSPEPVGRVDSASGGVEQETKEPSL